MALLEENLMNPFNAVDSSIAKSRFLRWGEDMKPFAEWCQQSWPSSQHTFDIIIAGDVMYKKDLPGLFFQTVDSLLSQQGVLWLCHVPRSTVNHLVVKQAAEDSGFQIQAQDTTLMEVNDCPEEDLNRAIVYRINR